MLNKTHWIYKELPYWKNVVFFNLAKITIKIFSKFKPKGEYVKCRLITNEDNYTFESLAVINTTNGDIYEQKVTVKLNKDYVNKDCFTRLRHYDIIHW